MLAEPAKTTLSVTITNDAGRIVRRYASDDVVKNVDPASLEIPAFWIVPKTPPPVTAGMHRIYWDLRDAAGTFVAPGRYRARLDVDGANAEQSFEVRRDPRAAATDDDLAKQYALASEVEALRSELAARIETVEKRGVAQNVLAPLRDARDALVELYGAIESGDAAPSQAQRSAYVTESATARLLLQSH